MKKYSVLFVLLLIGCTIQLGFAQDKQKMEPKETEDWSRKPNVVVPGKKAKAPSDAIVLFDRKNLDQWEKAGEAGAPAEWKIKGRKIRVKQGAGSIQTKQHFGNCQLHVEWRTPKKDVKDGKTSQGNGNSGVFFMDRYEVQVLNSFENETYYNGMAGSVYKQHIPLVNPTVPAGKWQVYDIIFTAPRFNADETLKKAAYVTVFLNGVLVQNHVKLHGPTEFIGHPVYKYHAPKGPIQLQNHNNEVSYRNIWIREL